MKDLQGWCPTARRSQEVLRRLSDASKRHAQTMAPIITNQDPTTTQEIYLPANTIHTPVSSGTPVPPQLLHPQPQPVPSSLRPTYIDVSFANANGYPETLNTAGQEVFMDNMFDTLNWSTSWDSPIGGPQMTNGNWDYSAMQNWAGSSMQGHEEYFSQYYEDGANMGFEMDASPTTTTADVLAGQYAAMRGHTL
jgi:hypothetical protein